MFKPLLVGDNLDLYYQFMAGVSSQPRMGTLLEGRGL